MKMQARRGVVSQVCLALLFCWIVRATTIERLSVEDIADLAQLIVRARCVSNSSFWERGDIWTTTTLEVLDTWKGPRTGRITIRLLGGTVGALKSSIAGIPRFREGDEVILFLEATKHGGFTIVSWGQGTFRIVSDQRTGLKIVTQDTAAFETFDPQTHLFRATGIRDLALEDFRSRVEAAIAAKNTGKKT